MSGGAIVHRIGIGEIDVEKGRITADTVSDALGSQCLALHLLHLRADLAKPIKLPLTPKDLHGF